MASIGACSRVNSPSNSREWHPCKIAFEALEKSHSCDGHVVDSRQSALRKHRILPIALEHMLDDPVVLLEGPRSVGTSTLLVERPEESSSDQQVA